MRWPDLNTPAENQSRTHRTINSNGLLAKLFHSNNIFTRVKVFEQKVPEKIKFQSKPNAFFRNYLICNEVDHTELNELSLLIQIKGKVSPNR